MEQTKDNLEQSISSLSEGSIYRFRSEPNKSFDYSMTNDKNQSILYKTTRTQPSAEFTSLSISKSSEFAE